MKEKSQIEKESRKQGRRSCCLPHWAGHRTPAAIGSTYRAKDFPGSIRGVSQPVRSMPSLWPCIPDNNGCKTTCSYALQRDQGTGVLRYGSMKQGVPFLFYSWNKVCQPEQPE